MVRRLSWHDLEISMPLGEGHSGAVYRGTIRRDVGGLLAGDACAIKRYKPWVLEQPGQLERIFVELTTGRDVRHPNLAEVIGVVADPEGRPALVMRYYDGPTLERWLQEQRAAATMIDVTDALRHLRAIADGVAALHGAGRIHRDLKPANVILAAHGPVVADFGVIRTSDYAEQTTTNIFLGTIRYAAPEYLFGDDYDARIDIYSLGAIAYELLIGKQYLGRHTHWARLVAIKRGEQYWIPAVEVNGIAARSTHALAKFCRLLLEHTCCTATERLSAVRIVRAIDRTVWLRDFTFINGNFVNQADEFTDAFGNAETAVARLREHLDDTELEVVRDLYQRRGAYGWTEIFAVQNTVLEAKLLRLGVIKPAARRSFQARYRLAPSIYEAMIIGLL